MECDSSVRGEQSDEKGDACGEQQPEARAVKDERVALDQRRALLKKRIDAIRMIQIERQLTEVLVAALRLDADRTQDDVVEPRRDVCIRALGGFGAWKTGVWKRSISPNGNARVSAS